MSQGKLIFTPPPGEPPPLPPLIQRLTGIGFLGPPMKEGGFRVGERFMQLISFMGCSPFLQLEPPEDGSGRFCQVHFNGPFVQPQLLPGSNGRLPRCPECRHSLKEWQAILSGTRACPHCGHTLTPESLDWGRNAGAGRLFMEVWEIYPGDGVPSDRLLACLRESGGEWRYFWNTAAPQGFIR